MAALTRARRSLAREDIIVLALHPLMPKSRIVIADSAAWTDEGRTNRDKRGLAGCIIANLFAEDRFDLHLDGIAARPALSP